VSDHLETDVHYSAVRKALADGNAAVMIGAGFSRNAEGGEHLGTWSVLAEELWKELNPNKPMDGFSPALVTQLGEQYARVFSRPALETVLKRLIPDDKVSPGILHDQLLDLPWSEIFTTNYDTLIERAADGIVGRAHFTVMSREDIPQSKILGRRRIVKLHGSFPSHRPFVFTEEDYRCYPDKFAPFVNLVRQSLLENIFCLIGFSGDDPNFLHWIGWVRDMLDKHSLPIYLFVGGDLSLGQRKLLEARGVTPVALPLPDGCRSSDYATRYGALFSILGTPLKPPDAAWASDRSFGSPIYHDPSDIQSRVKSLLALFPAFTRLRRTYPGWIVAPMTVRKQFAGCFAYMPIGLDQPGVYQFLEQESPMVALVLLAHYSWQQDVLLQCIDDRIAEIGLRLIGLIGQRATAELFDRECQSLKEIGVSSLEELQQSWRSLTLGLLRWARQELHGVKFQEIKDALESAYPNDRDLKDEIQYEAILLALYQGERDAARRLALAWSPRSADAYAEVRRGAALAELGESDLGLAACMSGLQRLRRNQKGAPESARYRSEEAWACLVIQNIRQAKRAWAFPKQDNVSDEARSSAKISQRLSELAALGFDAQKDRDEIAEALNAEVPPIHFSPKRRAAKFELGSYTSGYSYGTAFELRSKIEAAFAWLTLADRVALVPQLEHSSFYIDSYAQAAWWTQYNNSMQRILSVLVRTLNTDVLEPKDPAKAPHMTGWLSRYQVAQIGEDLAAEICERFIGEIERTLSLGATDKARRSISFFLEVFSRLATRLTNTDLLFTFAQRIIALHHRPDVWAMPQIWEFLFRALGTVDTYRSHKTIAASVTTAR